MVQADLLTTDNSVVAVQEGYIWRFGLHSLFKKIGICFKVKLVNFAYFLHVLHFFFQTKNRYYCIIICCLILPQLDPRFFQRFQMRVDDLNLMLILYHQDIDVTLN